MKMPYLGNTLKGWTTPTAVKLITKTVVAHQVVQTPSNVTLNLNYQPMPPAQVNRKPEEQRTWKWWILTIKSPSVLLKTDDQISIGGYDFRIQSAADWRTSGVATYEAIEDFTGTVST